MENNNSLFPIPYTERNGRLYPNIKRNTQTLTKFGLLWLEYMQHMHPLRRTTLRMLDDLMNTAKSVEEEAEEMMQTICDRLEQKDPPPQTDDVLVKARHLNIQRSIAEDMVLHDIVYKLR